MVDGFSVEHVWLPEGKTEEISSSTNLSRLKKPEETPHLANIRDEAEKGSSSIIVCEEIRYVFKYVSIIFKKYSRVIIQPEISQNPMGSATGRSPNPPWHRKLLLLQGALWSVRSFQPVPDKVGGSLREIFDCWLFHNSLSLLYHYTPKNPPKTLLYHYTPIMTYPQMKILVLYFISSFWAAYWWYLVFNMLEGCDYTDCTSLLVIFCQHICDQKRLIATQTKLIRQLSQILPTNTGQPMSSSQICKRKFTQLSTIAPFTSCFLSA